MHWSKLLESQQARALNPEVVDHWYTLVKEQIVDKGITPYNIYGMDKSGFPHGLLGTSRVIGHRHTCLQHKTGGSDQENVTALVTICGDGCVEPNGCFQGQEFHGEMGR